MQGPTTACLLNSCVLKSCAGEGWLKYSTCKRVRSAAARVVQGVGEAVCTVYPALFCACCGWAALEWCAGGVPCLLHAWPWWLVYCLHVCAPPHEGLVIVGDCCCMLMQPLMQTRLTCCMSGAKMNLQRSNWPGTYSFAWLSEGQLDVADMMMSGGTTLQSQGTTSHIAMRSGTPWARGALGR